MNIGLGSMITILISSFVQAGVTTKQEVVKGRMTDARNGATYNTVRIGLQHWMAENLDYQDGASWCYDNKAENCELYGRLYDWQTARNVCPQGWHLPTHEEWNQLQSVGNHNALELMSTTMKGRDAYMFSMLPAGLRFSNGSFGGVGYFAGFWSATEVDDEHAWGRDFAIGESSGSRPNCITTHGHSVRCLEN